MNRENVDAVLRSLRRVNIQGSFLGQSVAIRFGLSESDIETLEQLIDMGATTAGRLSEITGLTSGAVTRVIDRLEQAGYVRRVPDPADRRRVIVEVVPEKTASIRSTLDGVSNASAAEIGRYTDAQLALIADFLTRMEQVARDETVTLRESPEASPDGRPATSEYFAPIGGLERARLAFRSGANELLLRGSAGIGELYQAKFEGHVPQVRLRDGVVSVQYKGRWGWDWRERRADVALNASLPWDVEIVGGANKLQGKLSNVDLRSFELAGGVDHMRLTLGQPIGDVPIRLRGGAHDIRIERPHGAAVRLKLNGAAAAIELDRQRLGATGGGTVLESAGAGDARDRFEVEINGGAAKIKVTETG
ncbi:MAG: MarR family winged helix-turn-helix transcriptional regulator [Chloroflexota bacterium]